MLAFLLLIQLNTLVGGGASVGSSFTNTASQISPSVSIHSFPFRVKNLGVFSTFEWRNEDLSFSNFKVTAKDKTFVLGSSIRVRKPKVEPSLRIGLLHFRESTKVNYFGDLFAKGEAHKNALFLGAGGYIKIWRKVYLDPEISLAMAKRPVWKTTVRFGWMF